MDPQALKKLGGFGAVALAGVAGAVGLFNTSLYNVEAGHRAIVYNRLRGISSKIYFEGTHFCFPFLERPIIYDVRSRPRVLTSLSGSRDLQMVSITCRVLSRPDEGRLPEVYRQLGMDYDEKVLPSIINETLKSIISQFNASQLITQRDALSSRIREQLVRRARDFNILLDDVSLTHLSFSPEYERAVEAKQVAQQQAERSKYVVLRALEEKKSTIIKAQGEAEAAKLIGSAIKSNPAFLELRRIDTAKEVAQTLARSSNKILLSSEALLLNLAVGKNFSTEYLSATK
ncbi:prohibitin, putative [Eimeria tenella]|uniref:Prohibitin n=1 Tax=Eimeria tenella TaxID=5802 RepID=U6L3Y3_EIMTE|nr:prohibitin, putative [Eimeria tenella]CDJ45107.1 prohibitin, putative [Eimeria tenella]|eukprot:XP_013235854.1 prohibitin, putative [Eimeria tenella]